MKIAKVPPSVSVQNAFLGWINGVKVVNYNVHVEFLNYVNYACVDY